MNLFQESSFYQILLEEGVKKGIEKGRHEGREEGLITAREMLLSQGETLFGPPDAATRASIESIDDLERLKRLALRVLSAKTWEDLVNES